MTTESTTCAPNGVESPERPPLSPLNSAAYILGYLIGIKAAYTQRHQRSDNQHEQFLIEFHATQLEHAIELMEEVRDMLAAEMEWAEHYAS